MVRTWNSRTVSHPESKIRNNADQRDRSYSSRRDHGEGLLSDHLRLRREAAWSWKWVRWRREGCRTGAFISVTQVAKRGGEARQAVHTVTGRRV